MQRVKTNLPLSLIGALVSTWLSHAVQSLLQQVLPESLSHLSQRIHWNRTQNINKSELWAFIQYVLTSQNSTATELQILGCYLILLQCMMKYKGLTHVSSLAIDALFRCAAYRPVSIYKEAMTQRVAEPLHGRRNTATGG